MTDYVRITTACGVDQKVAKRAVEWITDRHAHAHQKGVGGLSAGGCEVRVEPVAETEMEAG